MVRNLTFEQIVESGSQSGVSIPSLADVVSELQERDELVMIEIKNLMSDQARQDLIDVTQGRSKWNLMSSIRRFEKSFPKNRKYWHEKMNLAGSKLVLIRRHEIDLFASSRNFLKWKLLKFRIKFSLN